MKFSSVTLLAAISLPFIAAQGTTCTDDAAGATPSLFSPQPHFFPAMNSAATPSSVVISNTFAAPPSLTRRVDAFLTTQAATGPTGIPNNAIVAPITPAFPPPAPSSGVASTNPMPSMNPIYGSSSGIQQAVGLPSYGSSNSIQQAVGQPSYGSSNTSSVILQPATAAFVNQTVPFQLLPFCNQVPANFMPVPVSQTNYSTVAASLGSRAAHLPSNFSLSANATNNASTLIPPVSVSTGAQVAGLSTENSAPSTAVSSRAILIALVSSLGYLMI